MAFTLRVIDISVDYSADGLIARFRKAGYEVIEPRQAADLPARR